MGLKMKDMPIILIILIIFTFLIIIIDLYPEPKIKNLGLAKIIETNSGHTSYYTVEFQPNDTMRIFFEITNPYWKEIYPIIQVMFDERCLQIDNDLDRNSIITLKGIDKFQTKSYFIELKVLNHSSCIGDKWQRETIFINLLQYELKDSYGHTFEVNYK